MNRRSFLALSTLTGLSAGLGAPARAQDQTEAARAFVLKAGTAMAAVVNGADPAATKKANLQRVVDSAIDVDGIARFCLGRFWPMASPAQQKEFVTLFHAVLGNNLSAKLNQYAGVSFSVGRATVQGDDVVVATVVSWPNYAPYDVRWVVETAGSAPMIVDVVAQGTSLRQTQRSDYASFLTRNGSNIDALLTAMRRQVAS